MQPAHYEADQSILNNHGDMVETLLEGIETSVELCHAEGTTPEIDARATLLQKLAEADQTCDHLQYRELIKSCSEHYAVWYVDGEPALHPMRCRQRACPICQEIRSKQWYHRIKAMVAIFTAPKHITLTIRSSDQPLQDQIAELYACFRRLRQRTLWKSRKGFGVATVEITFNATTRRWHPHLHVIANIAYLPHAVLQEAWKEITGGSFQVGITAVHGDIAGYVSKYVAKTSTVFTAPVDPYRLNAALKNKRLVQTFGTWPDLPKPTKPIAIFAGSIDSIIRRAMRGHRSSINLAIWLYQKHRRELCNSLYHAPPAQRIAGKQPDRDFAAIRAVIEDICAGIHDARAREDALARMQIRLDLDRD